MRIHVVLRGGDIDNASAAATNVDDKASGTSARHFHIALRIGNDDYNNYRQQRTTSVERQCLVREKTYSHCVVWWRRRQQSQAHLLRVKHRRTNQRVKHRRTNQLQTST
jgi:hypothetical protein